jgi:hypothetical protein
MPDFVTVVLTTSSNLVNSSWTIDQISAGLMTEFTTFFEKAHEQFAKKNRAYTVSCALGASQHFLKDQAYHREGPVLVIP